MIFINNSISPIIRHQYKGKYPHLLDWYILLDNNMYYTVYKITNLVNSKIYIGAHKTKDINDKYMGSGKILKLAQEKYGIENFKKEILEVFETSEMMYQYEAILVNERFIKRKDTYNLKEGGYGGFDHINDGSIDHIRRTKLGRVRANENGALKKAKERLAWLRENDKDWNEKKREKFKKSIREYYKNNEGSFKGRRHSEESKEKMREHCRKSKHQVGKNNSQYGTIWICNLKIKENKKIKEEEFEAWYDKGWIKGKNIWNRIEKEEIKRERKRVKTQKEKIKKQEQREKFKKIKEHNGFKSIRELHVFLKSNNMFNLSEESLRVLLK